MWSIRFAVVSGKLNASCNFLLILGKCKGSLCISLRTRTFSGRRFCYFSVASYATTVPVPTAPGAPGLPVVSINSSVRNNDPIKTRACESQMSNTERPSEPMIIL